MRPLDRGRAGGRRAAGAGVRFPGGSPEPLAAGAAVPGAGRARRGRRDDPVEGAAGAVADGSDARSRGRAAGRASRAAPISAAAPSGSSPGTSGPQVPARSCASRPRFRRRRRGIGSSSRSAGVPGSKGSSGEPSRTSTLWHEQAALHHRALALRRQPGREARGAPGAGPPVGDPRDPRAEDRPAAAEPGRERAPRRHVLDRRRARARRRATSGTSPPIRAFASSSAGAGGQGRPKRCPTTIPSSDSALSPLSTRASSG